MIELAFVACLAATPSNCEDHSLLYTDVSLMVCALQGQAELAAWTDVHPGWRIERWTCRTHDGSRLEA